MQILDNIFFSLPSISAQLYCPRNILQSSLEKTEALKKLNRPIMNLQLKSIQFSVKKTMAKFLITVLREMNEFFRRFKLLWLIVSGLFSNDSI